MTEKKRKAYIKENAKDYANMAIGYVKSFPCCLCANEKSDHSCWGGYKNKGACPIFKDLKRRLNVLETVESEVNSRD